MAEETEPRELFNLPLTAKEAWSWAFKVGIAAVVLWMRSTFVSHEEYEKAQEKHDARVAILEKMLSDINNNVTKVSTQLEDDRRHREREQGTHP